MNETQSPDVLISAKSVAVLAGLLIVCIGGGAATGLITANNINTWYEPLIKPGWTPPAWLFGPVWSLLYTLMAVAMWLVWRSQGQSWRDIRPAAAWFFVQLALNLIWTPVFFGMHRTGWALLIIALLNLAVAATIVVFARYQRLAAGLLVPYLIWCLYATSLNAGIWWLNR